jgi:hypothetical protein
MIIGKLSQRIRGVFTEVWRPFFRGLCHHKPRRKMIIGKLSQRIRGVFTEGKRV